MNFFKLRNWIQSEWRSRFEIWILLFVAFLLKLPDLSLPFFWDELDDYVHPAYWLAQNGLYRVFAGLHEPALFYGHTSGFAFLLGIIFKFAGPSAIAGRSLALVLTLVSVYFCFRIGEYLANRSTGLAGAIVFFFIPTIFSHSTMPVSDIGLMGFGSAAIYFFLSGELYAYLALALIATLMKETSLAITVPIFCYAIISRRKALFLYACPIALLFAFYGLEKLCTGKIFNFPFMATVSPNISDTLNRALSYAHYNFWDFQKLYRITSLATIGVALAAIDRSRKKRWDFLFLASIPICFLFGIAILTTINGRYFLPSYPIFCALSGFTLARILRFRSFLLAAAIFITLWTLPEYYGNGTGVGMGWEDSLQYRDLIQVNLDLAHYLELHHEKEKIYALWPINITLRDPYQGYVSKSLQVEGRPKSGADYDVLVFSESSEPDQFVVQKAAIQSEHLVLEKSFRRNGKFAEIWVRQRQK